MDRQSAETGQHGEQAQATTVVLGEPMIVQWWKGYLSSAQSEGRTYVTVPVGEIAAMLAEREKAEAELAALRQRIQELEQNQGSRQ